MEPMFTFIVPVYNVEQYIKRCINSLIEQSFSDFEILLIDDGSTDNSSQICDNYKAIDQRIRVIHKKNGGLSDARNVGIKEAKGEYIFFVDSDDYITSDSCKKVYNLLKNNKHIDIIVGEADEIHKDKVLFQTHSNLRENYLYKNKEYLTLTCQKKEFYMPAWINIYRRNFIVENQLFFTKGILHEDVDWTPKVFLKAKTILYLEGVFYHYIIRNGSITQTKKYEKNKKDLLVILNKLYNLFLEIDDNNLKKTLNGFLIQQYLTITGRYSIPKNEDSINLSLSFALKNSIRYVDFIKLILLKLNRKLYFKLWKMRNI